MIVNVDVVQVKINDVLIFSASETDIARIVSDEQHVKLGYLVTNQDKATSGRHLSCFRVVSELLGSLREQFECMFALSDAIAVIDLILAFSSNCATSDNYGTSAFQPFLVSLCKALDKHC